MTVTLFYKNRNVPNTGLQVGICKLKILVSHIYQTQSQVNDTTHNTLKVTFSEKMITSYGL